MAALIDAAIEARARGVALIGVSGRSHAETTAPDHPARHPTGGNLHDLPVGALAEQLALAQRFDPLRRSLQGVLPLEGSVQ